MPTKTQRITGWVLTGLLGFFLIVASGIPKFIDFPGKQEMFDKLGIIRSGSWMAIQSLDTVSRSWASD